MTADTRDDLLGDVDLSEIPELLLTLKLFELCGVLREEDVDALRVAAQTRLATESGPLVHA